MKAAGDNAIKLWREEEKEGDSSKEICSVYHDNDVNCIRLKKQDGHFLMASCSDDATIKLWKVHIWTIYKQTFILFYFIIISIK